MERKTQLTTFSADFGTLLRGCTKKKDLHKGATVHAEILKSGLLEKSSSIASSLVSMYAKCGALTKATQVLDELPVRDAYSWCALIAGYAQHGYGKEALDCFEWMLDEGVVPDAHIFSSVLKACGSIGAADKGAKVHDEIVRRGLLGQDGVVGSALVAMYAKCGALAKAQGVLDALPIRDVYTWSAMIGGYVQQGLGEKALGCFERMRREGVSPNTVTYTSLLKACGTMKAANKGERIHNEIVRKKLLPKDSVLGNALVDMYAKCGNLAKAQQVLDELPSPNLVSWSALIAGYVEQGEGKEALNCYEKMRHRGISPDTVTFISILQACGNVGAVDKGQDLHYEIVNQGILSKSILLGTCLVDMYAKCGALAKAQKVLDELPVRDMVTWSALITGYTQHGHSEEALNCFDKMQREGFVPNAVTFPCILKACGHIGAVDKGEEVHAEIERQELLSKSFVLGAALVDMYAKCGALSKAHEVLDDLPMKNVVTWSALIAGYAQHGQSEEALNCFEKMLGEGLSPDSVIFANVLHSCCHSGLLADGERYFNDMITKYLITPALEHHTCMIDLYARAGHFDKATEMIKKMPSSDHLPLWSAILNACRKWGNVELARMAFKCAVDVDKSDPAAYVCMSNIYAAAGMQEDAEKVESMRVANKAWEKPGRSWWIDVNGTIHSFSDDDNKHAQSKQIYVKLQDVAWKMLKEEHSEGLDGVLEDDAKEVLGWGCGHSEKLAVAYALINSTPGETIRVVKNIRICGDCHEFISFISQLEKRKIVIRDANQFHNFEGGCCGCGDYW